MVSYHSSQNSYSSRSTQNTTLARNAVERKTGLHEVQTRTYIYLNQRAASPCIATRLSSTTSSHKDASVIWHFTNASQRFPYVIPSKPVVTPPVSHIYRICLGSNSAIPKYLMIDVATPYPWNFLNAYQLILPQWFSKKQTHIDAKGTLSTTFTEAKEIQGQNKNGRLSVC